jgi:copper homeostasis protein CutC
VTSPVEPAGSVSGELDLRREPTGSTGVPGTRHRLPRVTHENAPRVRLEIAVQDAAGARVAAQGGADRVELCAALAGTGGLTPSAGMVAAVSAALRGSGVGVHVLVRPRAGGFTFSADELDIQLRDVRAVLDAGADGVVVGALDTSGEVDVAALDALVAAAGGAEITFHRAIDQLADPVRAMTALARAGVHRVLTSGGAARAGDGLTVLGALGFVLGGSMLLAFLLVDDLGLAFSGENPVPYSIVLGTIAFGLLVYWIMRTIKRQQGVRVEYAFAELPPEG